MFQGWPNRLVDYFQHAAASEQFIFYQRDIWLDSGRVAVHQETDCAGGCQHRYLRIAIAITFTKFRCSVPGLSCFAFQIQKLINIGNVGDSSAMEVNHFAHGIDVVFCERFAHAAAARVAVTRKRPHRFR